MADHVFAPGNDGFLSAVRAFLLARGASGPTGNAVTNVSRFIDFLDTDPAVTRPVDIVYIGSHGTDRASISIDLDDADEAVPRAETENAPEELLAAIAAGTLTFAAGTTDNDTVVRIRGCKIGQSARYLTLLRQAFGGTVGVDAPVFYDYADNTRDEGHYEWFFYDFEIARTTPFADRAAALTEFKARGFSRLDGTAVPDPEVDACLPPARWAGWSLTEMGARRTWDVAHSVPLGQTVGTRTDIDARRQFRHIVEGKAFRIAPGTPLPATDPDLRAMLKAQLVALNPVFDPAHEFPYHERFGFATSDDWIDGHSWRVVRPRKGPVRVVGSRHVYSMSPPVLDATGHLRFNFAPRAGSAATAVTGVPDGDADFFARV